MSKREALLGVSSAEFRDIAVSPCQVQTPNQRFGDGTSETMRARELAEMQMVMNPNAGASSSGSDSDSDDEDESVRAQPAYPASKSARPKPPKLQNFRMCLTALSQVYNLYFAAYGNSIWVYCPVGPMAQGLGEKPALIITHTMTSVGARIESHIPGWKKDDANHMIVGFFGDAEILVLCYENGDVAAYYTRGIATYITHHAQNPSSASKPPPRPFFKSNVGESAWGLAIHSKSRLIAVSSYKLEVTVFAFALTSAPHPEMLLKPPLAPPESAVLTRKRNWRIVLPVKRNAHNIPNVDFVSSPLGHAQKISAVDIFGHIWLLDIWRQETAPALIVPQDTSWGRVDRHMTWDVIALPESSFMDLGARRRNTAKAYFSGEASHARAIALGNGNIPMQLPFRNSRYWIDTTGTLGLIQDSKFTSRIQSAPLSNLPNPSSAPMLAGTTTASTEQDEGAEASSGVDSDDETIGNEDQPDGEENELDVGEYDEGDLEVEVSSSWGDDDDDNDNSPPYHWNYNPFTSSLLSSQAPAPDFLEPHLPNEVNQAYERFGPPPNGQPVPRMGMIYFPHRGMTYREPDSNHTWLHWLRRRKEFNQVTTEQNQTEIASIGEHTSFFVTDERDLRLLTTNRRFVDIYCPGPAGPGLTFPAFSRVYRINMTLHVPELNLVVAACQSGSVALVSLIKSPWALPTVGGDRSMRIDKILPTASEEDVRRVRPKVPLFGIAIGPVQEVEDETLRLRAEKARTSFSRMYRLVLHYRDHTVLSYLVSRPSPDDLQVI